VRNQPRLYSATVLLDRIGQPHLTYRNLTDLGIGERMARTIYANHGWLTMHEADRIATKLGTHIDLLWPANTWIDRWIETDLDDLTDWVHEWMDRRGIERHDTSLCGTVAGYRKHRRDQSAPCPDCVNAHTDQNRRWKRQSRERTAA